MFGLGDSLRIVCNTISAFPLEIHVTGASFVLFADIIYSEMSNPMFASNVVRILIYNCMACVLVCFRACPHATRRCLSGPSFKPTLLRSPRRRSSCVFITAISTANKQTCMQEARRHAGMRAGRHANRQTGRHAGKQTGKHAASRHAGKHRRAPHCRVPHRVRPVPLIRRVHRRAPHRRVPHRVRPRLARHRRVGRATNCSHIG